MSIAERGVSMLAVAAAVSLLAFEAGCAFGGAEHAAAPPPAEACDAEVKPARLDLTLKDMHGNDVNLASFKGKVILINFWATWCAPCKVEIPDLVELQEQYGDDLQVLGISVDDEPADMIPWAEQLEVNYPFLVGLNRDDVDEAYGPFLGIPQTFIISRDGTLCRTHAGIAPKETFEREIKALL